MICFSDKDSQKIWDRLTEKEQEEFARMLKDGRLANLVDTWTPWWTNKVLLNVFLFFTYFSAIYFLLTCLFFYGVQFLPMIFSKSSFNLIIL